MNRSDRQILHPFVWVIWLLIVLAWGFLIMINPKKISFQFADLLPNDLVSTVLRVGRTIFVGFLLLWTVVLLARPQHIKKDTVTNNWIDIVLALDISFSMEANDFAPNRMHAARDVLTQFVASREEDRVWLVVFAWKPFVSVPLTFDYGIVWWILERTSTATINQNVPWLQWTAVGDALLSSLTILENWREELKDEKKREQVIIMLTDGEANTWLDPVVVSWLAKEEWIKVYTVGIWSLQWWTITFDTAFGRRSQRVPWVDETTLKEIASNTEARYRRATDQQTFEEIFDEIATLETSDIEQDQVFSWSDAWLWILWCMLWIIILLLIESFFFPYVFGRIIPLWVLWVIMLCIIIALVNPWKNWKASWEWSVMIMLDVSTSMYVEDIDYGWQSISRIIAAKTMIERAVSKNPWSLFWLWAFAWEAVWILPLTTESNTLLSLLRGINAGTLTKQWTSIDAALQVAVDRFVWPWALQENKTIVVITDWWEDDIEISEALETRIKEEWISLMWVVVWTKAWWPIPTWNDRYWQQVLKKHQWEIVISSVNSEALAQALRSVDGDVNIVEWSKEFWIVDDIVSSWISKNTSSSNAWIAKRIALWLLLLFVLYYCFAQTAFFSFLTRTDNE